MPPETCATCGVAFRTKELPRVNNDGSLTMVTVINETIATLQSGDKIHANVDCIPE